MEEGEGKSRKNNKDDQRVQRCVSKGHVCAKKLHSERSRGQGRQDGKRGRPGEGPGGHVIV